MCRDWMATARAAPEASGEYRVSARPARRRPKCAGQVRSMVGPRALLCPLAWPSAPMASDQGPRAPRRRWPPGPRVQGRRRRRRSRRAAAEASTMVRAGMPRWATAAKSAAYEGLRLANCHAGEQFGGPVLRHWTAARRSLVSVTAGACSARAVKAAADRNVRRFTGSRTEVAAVRRAAAGWGGGAGRGSGHGRPRLDGARDQSRGRLGLEGSLLFRFRAPGRIAAMKCFPAGCKRWPPPRGQVNPSGTFSFKMRLSPAGFHPWL